MIIALLGVSLAEWAGAQAGGVHSRVPTRIDAGARHVIYLHGRIIEEQGRRPTSPVWGVYEYQQILDLLASNGFVVISEQRKRDTDMDLFAAHVAEQVRQLMRAGVRPEHVTVVGFSKGGGIATRTSALLGEQRVNFVFLAACGDGDFSGSDLRIRGRILSLYEESDDLGRSCHGLFELSGDTGERTEEQLHIGGGHGAFYRPHEQWLTPLVQWVRNARPAG
ncbi:MAG: alpha/beta hydrolase [Gemmatimonadaceae bacterium]